jgi:hypothetical protein
MKTFAFITMCLCSSLAAAQECGAPDARHWSTVVKLESAQVTLHWTGVYEGADSVCSTTYKTNLGQPKTLEVYGQPEINKTQNLLGFVSCADDGCEKEILIADIAHGVVLKTELPIAAPQFYLKAKWKGTSRGLLIEGEPFSYGKALPPSHFLCSVAENVQCARVL